MDEPEMYGQIVLYHDNQYGSAQIGLLVGNLPDRSDWAFATSKQIPGILHNLGIWSLEGKAEYLGRIPRILAN